MSIAKCGSVDIWSCLGDLQARAMLEWHKQASYCGRCGSSSFPILCGQRRQCSNSKCSNKLYPRIDPVSSQNLLATVSLTEFQHDNNKIEGVIVEMYIYVVLSQSTSRCVG